MFLSSELVSNVINRLQCWQFVWGSVADILRPLSKYLRAFRAFDSHFFVDHEIAP
jgi:hypothetical protein